MANTLSLNERAARIADEMADRADELRIAVRHVAGARVLDCGIEVEGGQQAGLALARVCLAGRAEVSLCPGEVMGEPCPHVQVVSDHPVAACMASQYAGWQISVGKFFAMGSGPMRAAYGKEELFNDISGREEAPVAVGVLETRKLPPEDVISYLAERLRLPAERITLLVAPASSMAGTVQVVARSLETALHKLHVLRFDLRQVVSGYGAAPLPPVGKGDLQAIGWTNDAILYGACVVLWVRADDSQLEEVAPRVPSNSSNVHGSPFAAIFERNDRDFYKIDPMLFSPAVVLFHNLKTGKSLVCGGTEPEILRQSFWG